MRRMTQLCLALLGLSVGVAPINTREFVPFFGRGERSLVDTFPFNSVDEGLPEREARVGDNLVSSVPFNDVAASFAGGKRCIDKVFMEEVTEYDTEIKCDHSYNRRCAKSLKTTYTAAQEEECDENFVKKCFIEYAKFASDVTVTVCRTPLVKDCDLPGEEVCSTQYESVCVTEQEEHKVKDDVAECKTVLEEKCEDDTSGYTTSTRCSKWPREECSLSKKDTVKYTPNTKCTKVPVELCGPAGCGFVEGEEECYDKTQTVVGDKPEETCSLDPQRSCKHVTKLVPKLEEVEYCFDVPKEVCVRSQNNPRKVARPVLKKWCYVPKCEEECMEAAARGECLPECEIHKGNDKCCAPCPSTCLAEARAQQKCSSQCQKYSDNPKCCFQCPARCVEAVRRRETDESCRKYQNIPPLPCFVEPDRSPCDDPICLEDAQRGKCSNECYRKYGRDSEDPSPQCCGTCPDLCKDYARVQEMTYINGTLDCGDFQDEACFFQCPAECRRAYDNGESLKSCSKYTYLDKCYLPPPCPPKCMESYRAGESDQSCIDYRSVDGCYRPCPSMCEQAYRDGETDPSCANYSSVKNCYRPCPLKCEQAYKADVTESSCAKYISVDDCYLPCPKKCTDAFKKEVTEPSCSQYKKIPGCYYTPCEDSCQSKARREEKCSGSCLSYAGNPKCCFECPPMCQDAFERNESLESCKKYTYLPDCYYKPVCPKDCEDAFRAKQTLKKCKNYKDEFNGCYYEKCSEECRASASRGETNPACRQHVGDRECYIPRTDCPEECQEKSLWGECPKACKEFEGNPDCCAPKCPSKCTNRRRSECSSAGVRECNGVAGCCPEHYGEVYGVGIFPLPNDQE